MKDIKNIQRMLHGLQTSEYGTYTNITFVGIPVEVDDTLTGGNFKVMISREMYFELKRIAEAKEAK